MEEILFQITPSHLDTGLRGFPVGYCTTSFVDAQKGLFYAEYPVDTLALLEPQEVIYLLYSGKKGNVREIADFFSELKARAHLSPETIKAICDLPKQGHPMKRFSAAFLLCGMIEGKGDYREDCLDLIAKLPHLAAVVINDSAGWGPTPSPVPERGYMESFVHMLQLPDKNSAKLLPVCKLFNILHYDHGGGNLSTFVGKSVASSLEDLYGSISASMCALAGPRHGRANQDCLEFTKQMLKEVGPSATVEKMEKKIKERLEGNQLIFGFGHAVLRVEDPRASVLYGYVQRHFASHPLVKIALLLREAGPKILSKNPKIADPYPNVDAISGVALVAAGFDHPEFFTILFGLSRAVGIAIQIAYDRLQARGGKGTPIVRPRYLYRARGVV